MEHSRLTVVAMAERCRELIEASDSSDAKLPASLQSGYLLWMTGEIVRNADEWPTTRLHRWIGFVQAGMMANQIVSLDDVKTMFQSVRRAFGEAGDDQDLIDHLDPGNSFRLEIGGEA